MNRSKLLDRRLAIHMLLAVNLAIAALLAGTVWLVARTSHQAHDARARDTTAHLVSIAQSNVAAEIARVDTLMLATLRELESHVVARPGDDAALNRALEAHRRLQPALEGLRLTDEVGRVRWGNNLPPGPPTELPLGEYFARVPEMQNSPPLLFGPVKTIATDIWVVVVVRQFHAGGRFRGLVYATISLDHFQKLFSAYQLGRQDAITLRTSPKLQLLVRHAPGMKPELTPGSTTVSQEFAAAFRSDPSHGTFVSHTAIDGVERTNAYRHVDGWPLVVIAGLENERLFEPWRAQTRQIALMAALAWLLVSGVTAAIYVALQRLAGTLRALSAETRRVQALLKVTADGIHILDRKGSLLAMSDSFARMLGTTPEALIGKHVSTWDARKSKEQLAAWFASAKDGDVGRWEIQHRRADGRIIDVELQLTVADIGGEFLVFASTRDITEKRRLLATLESSSARIRDLYDNAPCGYYSLDGDGVFVHANATLRGWLGMTEAELIGKARLVDFLDAPSQARFTHKFPMLKSGQPLDGLELRLVPPGAPSRYVQASVTAVLDAHGAFEMSRSVALDITAQHEAQEEAARLLRDQTAMLDNDIVGMVKLRNRVAVWRNRALDRIFGYGPGELEGHSPRLLYPDEASFVALGQQAYPALDAGQNFRTQIQLRHKDGHLIWIDLSGVKLSDDLTFWMMVDITAMKESQASMEHIAFHDALTELPNRLLLQDRLRQALATSERTATFVAVCFLDLDGFKAVNDQHGHDAGDALLREMAHRLEGALRANDTAARLGGDEFVLVMSMLQAPDEWRPILERALAAIRAPVLLKGGIKVQVDTSVGVALCPSDSTDPQTLLDMADHAMLRAKRAGKGRIEMARPRRIEA
ncbi:diguanylate cyclase domain-containing protein [Piscinibacter gummiphilus]|uniref:Diguanylate cyclase n=1 Tax=Piscinibacter gummiphilus TaxID=946333 RepID=A0ABZ0D068_9BURK|nr:diguanylate cyclase [Piscinibacter gummiphilus]WOB10645.1 diguanylate cyclase [Piscinibacter gummiphilus]